MKELTNSISRTFCCKSRRLCVTRCEKGQRFNFDAENNRLLKSNESRNILRMRRKKKRSISVVTVLLDGGFQSAEP